MHHRGRPLRATLTVFAVLILSSLAFSHGSEGATKTITGEVLDLACFLQHPADGQGPEHASCAQQCIRKGLAAGLKADDGSVYLLLGKGHDPIIDTVAPLAGTRATVTGVPVESGGLHALVLVSISPADG